MDDLVCGLRQSALPQILYASGRSGVTVLSSSMRINEIRKSPSRRPWQRQGSLDELSSSRSTLERPRASDSLPFPAEHSISWSKSISGKPASRASPSASEHSSHGGRSRGWGTSTNSSVARSNAGPVRHPARNPGVRLEVHLRSPRRHQ